MAGFGGGSLLSPLGDAAYRGNLEEVTRLLNSGVGVNQIDNQGQTTLYWASSGGHLEIITLLLDRGAVIEIQNSAGLTALMIASWKGNANVVSLLLERGANPSIKDNQGKTALEIARQWNKSDCVAILQDHEQTITMRQQQQREEEERRNREREIEEQKQRERQQEIEENKRNRELVSSFSTQLQQKDQEILVLQDQLSSREDSLRNSEKRILELTNEKNQAIERNDKLENELLKEKEKCDNQIQVLSKQLNSSQSTNRDGEEQLKEMMKKMETNDQLLVEKETLLTNLRDDLSRCGLQLETLMSEKESLKLELENANLQKNSQDSSIVQGKGVKGELFEKVEELKRDVISRFKHQKYLELTEQIKNETDKKSRLALKSKLKVLNYDDKTDPSTIISLEAIHSRVEQLQTLFEEKEEDLMVEDLVSSMLCEVDRLNLLTFLKVFEVEEKIEEETWNDNDALSTRY